MSSNILTAIDRKTRYAILLKNMKKNSMEVISGLKKQAQDLGIRSVTFDNGSEFTRHEILKKSSVDTYFCDPGKPWQKGSIEHFNGMLRRRIPFDQHPDDINQELLDSVSYQMNHMPRESLGFLTPCEAKNNRVQSEINRCCVFNLT
jgi:IS30 family transposase